MFRVMPRVRNTVRDLIDSIRFMSLSDRRRVYVGTAVVSSVVTSALYLGSHTVWLEKYHRFMQAYKQYHAMWVNPELRSLLKTTIAECHSGKVAPDSVRLFTAVGPFVYGFGVTWLPSGAYIGVPFSMNFTNTKQLNVDQLRLMGQYRTRRSADAPVIKQLFEGLILSESAKKFALAHQTQLLSSAYVPVKATNIFAFTLASFFLGPWVNGRLGFTNKKRLWPRMPIGMLCFVGMAVLGAVVDQLLDEMFDLMALKRVLNTGDDQYRRGAAEFYRKLIQSSRALHELMGKYGPMYFTEDGRHQKVFCLMRQSYESNLILAQASIESHKPSS